MKTELIHRHTTQKKLIFDALGSLYHPTAEEVYKQVVIKYPNISLATVYRNLNQLADTHEINRLRVDSNQFIYDVNTTSHHHFKCDICNKIIDLPADLLNRVNAEIEEKYHIHLNKNNVVFTGVCDQCKTSN